MDPEEYDLVILDGGTGSTIAALAATNRCEYCASAHSTTAKIPGLEDADVTAALQGKSEDVREAAALRFATAVVEKRGRIDDADFKAVTEAGFTQEKWLKLWRM
jgi:AhpD family alkylhydroperoxidase